jgi:hypothetical protein
MRAVVLVTVALVATTAVVKRGLGWAGEDGDHTAPRAAAIDALGSQQVRVESGSGTLRVVGVDGSDAVRVQGTAHASRAGMLDHIKLDLRRENGVVVVRPRFATQTRRWFGGGAGRQSMDLTVEVPAAFEADVTAGSGDATVQGVSALQATDGSGNLSVTDVRGPVRVKDGSGDLELRGIEGDVWLEDGSGNVSVERVRGSLVAADGSGELTASGVQGDVLVRRDGSGGIDVSDVGGRLTVEQDGSGEVNYRDVRGAVRVPKRRAERH